MKVMAEDRLRDIVNWAESRKNFIERDERFRDKPALVEINAPLALIQVALKTEHRCLSAILKMAGAKQSKGL